jgi:L-asparaginase / beta-aspartyl-peptidase
VTASFVLAIHGGAGTIRKTDMTEEREAAYHAGLHAALVAGQKVLEAGGSALDAVTEAVVAMEDNTLFNAGRGAVYTSGGKIEMDAAVMDGRDRSAGAVAGVLGPRNPVRAARAVREGSPAVMLHGSGALDFCREAGVQFEEAPYFHTAERWDALQKELDRRRSGGPDDRDDSDRHGTVGAVAIDSDGNLAAATSTGGMTGKPPGRIGDTPVFGAGTWAHNGVCAISATGTGEVFIRHGAGHEIDARMRLGGQSVEAAASAVVTELAADHGDGGLIAVDSHGNVALPFNSQGMYRGVVTSEQAPRTAIYAGEELAERQ